MSRAKNIYGNVYQVGGPGISDDRDCCIYLIDFNPELVLVDAGAGTSVGIIAHNIMELGFDPMRLHMVVLTHAHIDHVGGAAALQSQYGALIAVHVMDAQPLENADQARTAASWYGVNLPPIKIDRKLEGEEGFWTINDQQLYWVHTPGHTPGSISLYLDTQGRRVLMGQDIHGPFAESFGSDMRQWSRSMNRLLDLNSDILCEGHFGIYYGKQKVKSYIESYLKQFSK